MKKIILLLLSSLTLLSCSEDWLKPDPLSFYAPENVYIDKQGFEALLVTLRKNLGRDYYEERNGIMSEAVCTDLGVAGPKNNQAIRNLDLQLTPSSDGNYWVLDYFDFAYTAIRNANVLLSRLEPIDWGNPDEKNQMQAEGYFHRSYWYYRLVNQFGDVPFISEELTEPKLDFYSHSRWAILKRIQSEMEFAVQWLPETAAPGAVTKGAGNHLLAKIYLANNEFEKAVQAATAVINGPYSLMTERFGSYASDPVRNVIWDLARPENIHLPENTETILAAVDRFEAPTEARTTGTYLMRNYNPAWWNQIVKDSSGGHGTMDSGPMYDSLGRGNGFMRPSPFYLYGIWGDPDDLRRSDINWMDKEELLYNRPTSPDFMQPIDPSNFAAPIDTFQQYYAFPHYKTYVPQQSSSQVPNGGNGDQYIFRLAETYLLRAEAYFWQGNTALAAADINAVRGRAHAAPVNPGEVTIDYILDERARELFAEEPRKTELTRIAYIIASQNLYGYSLDNFSQKNFYYDRVMAKNEFYRTHLQWGETSCQISPFHVLWPVPADAINSNSLGVINQNPGYVGSENNQPPLTDL